MKKHYNLYHLFLEDKLRNPMAEERRLAVRAILEAFYAALRPPNKKLALSEKNIQNNKTGQDLDTP